MTQHRRDSDKTHSARLGGLLTSLAVGLVLLLSSAVAEAREVVHVVQKGQYLNLIAKRYHTSAEAIRKRNGLRSVDLEPGMKLVIVETEEHRKWREHVERTTGRKVKERVVAKKAPAKKAPAKKAAPDKAAPDKAPPKKVATKKAPATMDEASPPKASSETRGTRAEAKASAKTTPLAPPREERVMRSAKQRVAPRSTPIVGADEASTKAAAANESASPAPAEEQTADESYAKAPERPGRVTLIRYGEKFRGQLVSDGEVIAKAGKRVDRLMRSLRTGKMAKMDRRLLALLTEVSDHFGGRTIVVVSGFRPYSPKQYTRNSRHNHGKAVDFKVVGVPTDAVFEYCRQLDEVGCGYYPNSGFIHMDVRERKTQWTDYAGPGQAPRYAERRDRGGAGKAKTDGSPERSKRSSDE